jgi:hypothetical protein
MSEQGRQVAGAAEFQSDATLTRSIVGIVKARDLHLDRSGAGFATTEGDLSITNGGCGPVLANGGVTIQNGGCGPLIANGDVSIENGGTQAILAGGGATIGRNAFVGVVVSPKVTVADGGRVLLNSPMALAVGVGAGVVAGLLSRLARR